MVFRTRVVTIGGRELVRIGAFPFEQTFLRLRLMILWPRICQRSHSAAQAQWKYGSIVYGIA